MTPIQTNKTVFFDKGGDPLTGSIYIGQPSQDPRTSPKTVTFRDAGGVEFTASQANGLTVSAGRIVYNGKPIVAMVDGDHSMLTFDESGLQVDYSPLVEPSTGSGSDPATSFTELIRVGLILSDIKSFDVAVGDLVRNIGLTLTSDGLGKNWLARSATGSPGDDVDLIDFTNGLQGAAIVSAIGSGGTGATTAAGARTALDVIENGTGTVTSGNIAADAIVTDKLSNAAVTEGKIAAGAVTNGKVPSGALGAEKFQSGTTERDWALGFGVSAGLGAVGTYAFLKMTGGGVTAGGSRSGSDLSYSSTAANAGTSPSGTWRGMGTGVNDSATLFLRIS